MFPLFCYVFSNSSLVLYSLLSHTTIHLRCFVIYYVKIHLPCLSYTTSLSFLLVVFDFDKIFLSVSSTVKLLQILLPNLIRFSFFKTHKSPSLVNSIFLFWTNQPRLRKPSCHWLVSKSSSVNFRNFTDGLLKLELERSMIRTFVTSLY